MPSFCDCHHGRHIRNNAASMEFVLLQRENIVAKQRCHVVEVEVEVKVVMRVMRVMPRDAKSEETDEQTAPAASFDLL